MKPTKLAQYRKKRDFKKTPEPRAKTQRRKRKEPIFVIQEHHARRLHFDFRLEEDGVLKSWAVTSEPTMTPSEKHLAIQTEDHPLDYATFEGEIPAGEYGGGTVSIWDHGTFRNLMEDKPMPLTVSQAIELGQVEVFLKGKRLKGRFVLVKMEGKANKGNEWLFIKMKPQPVGLVVKGKKAKKAA